MAHKSPIQLRWDHSSEEAVTVHLVEKDGEGNFSVLTSRTLELAKVPQSLTRKLIQKGIVAFCDAKVTGIKEGREKFDTVANLLFPKLEEGILEDKRGATIEEKAVQIISGQNLSTIRKWEREEPEAWQTILSREDVQEEIAKLKEVKEHGKGTLELSDLIG